MGLATVRVRDPQRLLFAVFLLVLGALGLALGWKLPMGTAVRMGAGYLPKVLSGILILFGAGLSLSALAVDGPPLDRWAWRRLGIVLAALCLFGILVEHAGLFVTTAVVVLFATAAAPDRRWREAAVFALVMAGFCTLLFSVFLGLPLPALPS
ncbi:MAG: tripartite tricarboxylate transporter TctB family protein [Alphaproteobacteria bacterium]|nr:tripartite tricarboxylate transporter TctB family protein [Alphaproteobacteria bacterium]